MNTCLALWSRKWKTSLKAGGKLQRRMSSSNVQHTGNPAARTGPLLPL